MICELIDVFKKGEDVEVATICSQLKLNCHGLIEAVDFLDYFLEIHQFNRLRPIKWSMLPENEVNNLFKNI